MPIVKHEKSPIPFRRRFPRRQFKGAVGVLVSGNYELEAGLEIGEGGMLFKAERELVVGAMIVLNFYIPKRDFVSVRGEILYILPDKTKPGTKALSYGVRFNDLPFESRRMIRDYIAEKTVQEVSLT